MTIEHTDGVKHRMKSDGTIKIKGKKVEIESDAEMRAQGEPAWRCR